MGARCRATSLRRRTSPSEDSTLFKEPEKRKVHACFKTSKDLRITIINAIVGPCAPTPFTFGRLAKGPASLALHPISQTSFT
ncbi:hypothetical protein RB195_021571 [Necator americanus]|uniref:Uncharacterized protein n=1 Tax=Necator americanus TaxID=51031 RepID=A0ABR1EBP6_NECAM